MVDNPFTPPAVAQQTAAQSLISVEQQRAIAEVQAQLIIARANPRDPRHAMDQILQDCTRLSLAESALYEFARGGTEISGPSIRLMETIARRWGNIASAIKEVSRRDGYSECVAFAWDLESNYRDEKQFQVRHWRDRKGGGGYRVTDERDIYEMIANQGQRRKRAALQAVIPGDVIEAAVEQCETTITSKADTSPEGLKRLVEAFAQFGVSQEQIEVRCQRRLDAIRPAQVVMLRRIWASLRDEMSQPGDWFEMPQKQGEAPPPRGTEALRAKMAPKAPPEAVENVTVADVSREVVTGDAPFATSAEVSSQDPPKTATVILPAQGPSGTDWTRYADELIAVARTINPVDLYHFRVVNSTRLNSLRTHYWEEYLRVEKTLKELEEDDRSEAPPNQGEVDIGLAAAPAEEPAPELPGDFIVKAKRRGRGWDWPDYAHEIVALARRQDPMHIGEIRQVNARMIDGLRIGNKDQWQWMTDILDALENGEDLMEGEEDNATMT